MDKYDYIAIDFETANASLDSACSIGIIAVKNDIIVDSNHFLINPHQEFSTYNIAIHGITESDCYDALDFKELYPKIKHYFDNTLVFAHNAGFDVAVLKALVERYGLETPNIQIGCTLRIAQKLWRNDLVNCKLNTISEYLEVEHNHHNALSDAYICTEIIKRAKRVRNVASEEELYASLGLLFGEYNIASYRQTTTKIKQPPRQIVKESILKEKVIYFAGKPKKMTKKQFSEKLQINGCFVSKELDRTVDYFVAFTNCPKAKIMRALALKEQFKILRIVDEETILGWLI